MKERVTYNQEEDLSERIDEIRKTIRKAEQMILETNEFYEEMGLLRAWPKRFFKTDGFPRN